MAASDVNQLVEKHLSLVQAIARKVKKTLNASIDVDDLVGYGSRGWSRRPSASTPATAWRSRPSPITGSVARSTTACAPWAGTRRADYARYRAEERANEYLRNRADREGAARPRGAAAGAKAAEPARRTPWPRCTSSSSVATVHITSLEAASSVPDESLPAADVAVDNSRLSRRVRQAVAALPDKERRLMELYYFADKNLEEAGAGWGSRSRGPAGCTPGRSICCARRWRRSRRVEEG